MVTLLGLGLSVDYGLLLVARYREELERRLQPDVGGEPGLGHRRTYHRVLRADRGGGAERHADVRPRGLSGAGRGRRGDRAGGDAGGADLHRRAARLGPQALDQAVQAVAAPQARYGNAAEIGFFARLAPASCRRRPLVTALVGRRGAARRRAAAAVDDRCTSTTLQPLPRSLPSVRCPTQLVSRFGQAAGSRRSTVVARTDAATLDGWATALGGRPGRHAGIPGRSGRPESVHGGHRRDRRRPRASTARGLVDQVPADRPAGYESWVTGDAAVLNDLLGPIQSRLPLAIAVTVTGDGSSCCSR